ncbi:MAG: hypothetical protein NC089_01405 [Bacteroides sp.]|nr:hypothetical protein [Bacteroides sp.]MCM1548779.1 hypothetical protein [Clostridium sp.]
MLQFRHKSLQMYNVLWADVDEPRDLLVQGDKLKQFIIDSGFSQVGPLIYSLNAQREYQVGTSINEVMDVEGMEGIYFQRYFKIQDCLAYQHAFEGAPIAKSRMFLKQYAQEKNLIPLDGSFYHVLSTSFGYTIVDIYYPLEKESL